MKKFIKLVLKKIKSLDNTINSYNSKTMKIAMPSKAYLNWGINLALEGKIHDAIEKFEMSSNMPLTDPENFLNWGIALAKLHRFDEAVQKFNEALRIDKTYSAAYSLKGAALVELNEVEEAIDCYKRAVKFAPYDPEIYVNWGVALARLGQKSKAEAQFKKALSLSLTHVNASFLLGVVLYEQNKLKDAQNSFNYTIKLDPMHSMAFYYLSLIHSKLEEYDSALQCAKIAVQYVPFRIDFMVNLAECYYDVKDIKMVIKTYRSIELIAPDAYPLLISAGIFWQKVKKFKRSLKYLELASQKSQADYLTQYYLAVTYAGLERYTEAKEILEKIVAEQGDMYDAVVKLAILYKMETKYDVAINLLEDLFKRTSSFNKFHNLLGECYRLQGNIDKAIENFKKTLEYYPDNKDAYLQLAQIYHVHIRDLKNATRMIRAAYKLDKENANTNSIYALILADDGDIENALEKIEAAISLDENNIEYHLRKIYVLKKSNYLTKYHETIEEVKSKFPEKIDYIDEKVNLY